MHLHTVEITQAGHSVALLVDVLNRLFSYFLSHSHTSIIIAVVDETLSVVSAKPVLSYFAERIPTIPSVAAKSVCEFALARIQGRIVSFEEQVCCIN